MQQRSDIGLGASEIAAVAGLNPFAGPWDVWAQKVEGRTFPDNEYTEWGRRLEPAIRQKYCDETGAVLVVPSRSIFHPRRQWQRATPDGMDYTGADPLLLDILRRGAADLFLDHPPQRLFQAKNVGEWAGRVSWDDGVPVYVQIQEQWEMDVTGAVEADVAALIGGNHYVCSRVHRDGAFIADLVDIGEAFMRRVEKRIPPDIDHTDACREHLTAKLRRDDLVQVVANEQMEAEIEEWKKAHIELRHAKESLELRRNRVRALFASAKAHSIQCRDGVIGLRGAKAPTAKAVTDYELVARLVASSVGMPNEEFQRLVEAATKTHQTESAAPTIAAPKKWSKE